MKNYKNYAEVIEAADDCGMTVEEFYFSTPAEYFENVREWTAKTRKVNRQNHRNYA